MSFVKKKPRLPIGTVIPTFPPIQKPLHADLSCEVYMLTGQPGFSVILVSVPGTKEAIADIRERLVQWWAALGPDRLSIQKLWEANEFDVCFLNAVLQITGRWIGTEEKLGLDESQLYGLITSLVDEVEAAAEQQVLPVLQPSLLWTFHQSGLSRVTPLFVTGLTERDEAQLISDIGCLVYWLATGIDPRLGVGNELLPLSRWCKSAGSHLSDLVGRCLDPRKVGTSINSVAALRAELARHNSDERAALTTESGAKLIAKDHFSQSKESRGLSKVAGMHKLKDLLERDVVRPLKDPEPFKLFGLTIPNGILLYGPPGCGKTYIARQLAEELGCFFTELIPSGVASPYIHQTVVLIREAFETAVEKAPAVLFIDEFEALVPARSELGGHQQYKSEEVNEFLAHLNECAEKNILVVAASNEPWKIDPAIFRPGRIDKLIPVELPDSEARAEMLEFHTAHRPFDESLDFRAIAEVLDGYSAADIRLLVDEAARYAKDSSSKDKLVKISTAMMMQARERVPASVTKEQAERYLSFKTRGI